MPLVGVLSISRLGEVEKYLDAGSIINGALPATNVKTRIVSFDFDRPFHTGS